MADGMRSLFETSDGLELALDAKRRSAIADAEQFDHLIGWLVDWDDQPLNRMPGAQRMWSYGGTGTPDVPEFAVCEIGSVLGMSPNSAAIFVGDLLDIGYRLPRLDAALHRGDVDAWRVRKVASATREFTLAEVTEADRRLAAETLGDGTPMLCRVSMPRLRHILEQIRIRTRPDDADHENKDGRDERNVRLRPVGSGLAALDGLLSGEDGQRLDQRLDQIVGWLRTLGDERPKTVLRSVAIGYLTEPDSLDMLYDQVARIRATTGDTSGEPETDSDGSEDSADAEIPATESGDDEAPAGDGVVRQRFAASLDGYRARLSTCT